MAGGTAQRKALTCGLEEATLVGRESRQHELFVKIASIQPVRCNAVLARTDLLYKVYTVYVYAMFAHGKVLIDTEYYMRNRS